MKSAVSVTYPITTSFDVDFQRIFTKPDGNVLELLNSFDKLISFQTKATKVKIMPTVKLAPFIGSQYFDTLSFWKPNVSFTLHGSRATVATI
jgi:hypothetical protein